MSLIFLRFLLVANFAIINSNKYFCHVGYVKTNLSCLTTSTKHTTGNIYCMHSFVMTIAWWTNTFRLLYNNSILCLNPGCDIVVYQWEHDKQHTDRSSPMRRELILYTSDVVGDHSPRTFIGRKMIMISAIWNTQG